MTDFKIGDRVFIVGDAPAGEVGGGGVITSLTPDNFDDVVVAIDTGEYAGYEYSYKFKHVALLPPTVEELKAEIDMLQMTIDEGQEILGEKEERIAFLESTLGIANDLIQEQQQLLSKALAVEEVVGKVVDDISSIVNDLMKRAGRA
jgi:hypothetical protein